MARILVYTSPARGHLFPVVSTALELADRGHRVAVRTYSEEIDRMAGLGLEAAPVSPAIEARHIDDWKGQGVVDGIARSVRTFAERGALEIDDLAAAIDAEKPDVVLVDIHCWGAGAQAEKSGLPWAYYCTYFLPLPSRDVPPFGPGLRPRHDVIGLLRDAVVRRWIDRLLGPHLHLLNQVRARAGVPLVRGFAEIALTAPRILYYTAEPLEYRRSDWPSSLRMLGPGAWDPPAAAPPWLGASSRPVVLVTCSTEFLDDAAIIDTALEALADESVDVVATSAAIDPERFHASPNARVERFVPHSALLPRAACVVCHGGMGITQKALAHGVPVCVIPFGRDQFEVATRVEVADAGVQLSPKRLTPSRLRRAVRAAMGKRAGARRVARGFAAAGGPGAAADALEELLRPGRRKATAGVRAARLP